MSTNLKKKKVYVAIMAGGTGTRFWPESTDNKPKQFLDILGTGQSLIQMTYDRFLPFCGEEQMIVVTNQRYKQLVMDQLPDIPEKNILCEPSKNNTAPSVAYTTLWIEAEDPSALIIMTPADHIVLKLNNFNKAIQAGLDHAGNNDHLVTLGISPTRPDTGYGYIQLDTASKNGIKKVSSFKEKPALEVAEGYVKSGNFVWNSGMFIWSVKSILKAFQKHEPSILKVLSNKQKVYRTEAESAFIKENYPKTKSISIDYAILEKADNVYALPVDIGWSDLGTWKSLHLYLPGDVSSNRLSGKITASETSNSIIRSSIDRPVIVKGLENYIVIDSRDGLLIYPMEDEQELKNIHKQ